jgi:hypothetical protein
MLDGNISYLFETITTTTTVYLIFNVFSLVKMSSEKLFCWFVTKKKKKKKTLYIKSRTKVVSSNKNIHLSLDVLKEKVGNLPLNMCSVFQSNSYNNIPTCVMNYYMFTSTWHQSKWISRLSMV